MKENDESKGEAAKSKREFEEALRDLIVDAVLDGISVKGGWDISRDDTTELPDFTVEIYEVNPA